MKIPNIIPVLPDETMLSYMQRLAVENGYNSALEYLKIAGNETRRLQKSTLLKYEDRVYCKPITELLPGDPIANYLGMSVYPAYASFMQNYQQTEIVSLSLRPVRTVQTYGLIKPLAVCHKICPACAENDIKKYGYAYFHRTHQIPGLKVCPVHNISLAVIKDTHIEKPIDIETAVPDQIPDYDMRYEKEYARFITAFMDARWNINIKDVFKAIRLKAKVDDMNPFNAFGKASECIFEDGSDVHFGFTREKLQLYLVNNLNAGAPLNITRNMRMAYIFFRDPKILGKYAEKACKEKTVRYEAILDKVKDKGYEIVNIYPYGIIRFRHKCCGTEFYETLHGFDIGWRCPKCQYDIPDREMYETMFKEAAKGEYAKDSLFDTSSSISEIMSLKTGEKFTGSWQSFVNKGMRGVSDGKLTKADLQKRADDGLGKGKFTIISVGKNIEDVMVRCNECGFVFQLSYTEWLKKGHCPNCKNVKKYVENRVKDLTGNDYSIIDDIKDTRTKIRFLHNKCGQILICTPEQFLYGLRCKYCKEYHFKTNDEFARFVSYITFGRYRVLKINGNSMVTIEDQKTGGKVYVRKRVIIQELVRPTKSALIKGPRRKISGETRTNDSAFLDMLKAEKPAGFLFSKELPINETVWGNRNHQKTILRRLISKGLVNKCGLYIYIWDNDVTEEDIFREVTWCRNGSHIGYRYGTTFLYEAGISERESMMKHYAANFVTGKGFKRREVGKYKGQVEKPLYKVTENNWKILEALHSILYIWRNHLGAYVLPLYRYIMDNGQWDGISEYVGKCGKETEEAYRWFAEAVKRKE